MTSSSETDINIFDIHREVYQMNVKFRNDAI